MKKRIKRGVKGPGVSLSCARTLVSLSLSLFSSRLLDQHALMPQGCIFLYFLNKTDLSKNYNIDCLRDVTFRGLYRQSLQIFVVMRQN